MHRISEQALENLILVINNRTNNPIEPYTKLESGEYVSNPGNYHLSSAYSGHKLVQVCENGKGIREISTIGFGTKRELYNWLHLFINKL